MKISVSLLKELIREALLTEETCPICGSKGAYVGLNDVECVNKKCPHYSERQAREINDAISPFHGEIDVKNMTTKDLISAITEFLRSKGYTNVGPQ